MILFKYNIANTFMYIINLGKHLIKHFIFIFS